MNDKAGDPIGYRGSFDPELERYRSFFDTTRAERALETCEGTALMVPLTDLLAVWRGLANAHAMPYIMFELLKSQWNGFNMRDVGQLAGKLSMIQRDAIISHLKLTVTKQQQLSKLMSALAEDYARLDTNQLPEFPQQEVWQSIIAQPDFGNAVCSSQAAIFGAIYFQFEHFVRRAMCAVTNDPNFKLGGSEQQIVEAINRYIGDKMGHACISDPHVKFIRQVRNALAHAGGRVSDALRKQIEEKYHFIAITDDRVQIFPVANGWAFTLLMDRIESFITAAKKKLQVAARPPTDDQSPSFD